MTLAEDLERLAATAATFTAGGEEVAGVVAAEPAPGTRVYLCAFAAEDAAPTWLVLDEGGEPVRDRRLVRQTASIAALCEIAEEVAAGGDLDELRAQLVALRITENPPGIDEAEEAVLALQAAIGAAPRLATPAHLDGVGAATLRVERALGDETGSPFAQAMRQAPSTAEAFAGDVESRYKLTFDAASNGHPAGKDS